MEYKEVILFLNSLERIKGIKLGLDRVNGLLEKLGNPHKGLKIIHVAGTNGKGSVCAMVDSILQEAGYRVGRYTSPHLADFRERFLVNNKRITEEDVIKYFGIVKKHHTNQTYFEFITAMAFLYFRDKNADFLVLEVGMGGRLDATNVITPLVSVITNVSLEHTKCLGRTVKAIAYEKAGIIKEGITSVSNAKKDALEVIKKACKERNSELFPAKDYIKRDGFVGIGDYKHLELGLKGDFQIENASTALAAIDVLKQQCKARINKSHITNGLRKARWPGRLEFIGKNILVDCAHNPAAFLALSKEIKKLKQDFKRLILVIGILKDKDVKGIIKIIEPLADAVIIAKPKTERAAEPEAIAKYVKKEQRVIADSKEALSYAKSIAKSNDLILVAGSIYLVGEILG